MHYLSTFFLAVNSEKSSRRVYTVTLILCYGLADCDGLKLNPETLGKDAVLRYLCLLGSHEKNYSRKTSRSSQNARTRQNGGVGSRTVNLHIKVCSEKLNVLRKNFVRKF